jgi:hypothetical protein
LQWLLDFAAPSHVLCNSDFPFAQAPTVARQAADMAEMMGLQGIFRFGNIFESGGRHIFM